MLFKQNHFNHGIDRKFDKDFGQADRLHTLQNARLFKRGEVGYVSRIEGYTSLLEDANLSNPLDLIEHKEQLFALTKRSEGQYSIFIYDINTNTLLNEIQYESDDGDFGELNSFEDYVFIEPHNKFLFDDGGTWTIHDFISTVPTINEVTPDTGGNFAEGSIAVNSGFVDQQQSFARARISVQRNIVPEGRLIELKVLFEKDDAQDYETDTFIVSGAMSVTDLAERIALAINNDLDQQWSASVVKDREGITRDVQITAVNGGFGWNGYRISIDGAISISRGSDTTRGRDRGTSDRTRTVTPRGTGLVSGGTSRSETNITTPDIYVTTSRTSGGRDLDNESIRILISIFPTGFRDRTDLITESDTATSIANKISTVINRSPDYEASVTNDVVTITAINASEEYNGDVSVSFIRQSGNRQMEVYTEYVDIDITPISGGGVVTGGLQPFTDYWYKVRFVYSDGHRTNTSYPVHVNTRARRNVILFISVEDGEDVFNSGSVARVEIFRKEPDQEFRLIEVVTDPDITNDVFTYTDDGSIDIRPLAENPLVWTKNNKSSEFIQNRLVRANVEYFGFSLDENNFEIDIDETEDNENTLPVDSLISVYAKPLYKDGTFGFHKKIDTISTESDFSKLSVDQTDVYESDRDIKEFGFYIESKLNRGRSKIAFNSAEIANQNLATQESLPNDDSIPDEFPIRTRVLYGYKYVLRLVWENINPGIPNAYTTLVFDDELRNGEPRQRRRYFVHETGVIQNVDTDADRAPNEITLKMFDLNQKYIKTSGFLQMPFEEIPGSVLSATIYKMADADGIIDAAFSGNLFLSIREGLTKFSSSQRQSDLEELEIRVIGAVDQSENYSEIRLVDSFPFILPPTGSKIYLQLEESPLDDIDDPTVNMSDQRPISVSSIHIPPGEPADELISLKNNQYSMGFELFNIEKIPESLAIREDQDQTLNDASTGIPYTIFTWDEQKFRLFSDQFRNLPIMFIGAKDNEIGSHVFDYSPFAVKQDGLVEYVKIKENIIPEDKIVESDIIRPKNKFPNQIIWSDPIIREAFESGARNFRFDSFFNLPTDNGEIVKLTEFGGRLLAFCERGLAQLNIGEVVTQQQSGELAVDTTRFITNYTWLSEGLKDIRPQSIMKFEGMLFFSDGYDVYLLSNEGLRNISNGAIDLNGNDCVGSIDPVNGEYRISDCIEGVTWAYSFNINEWFGPYEYSDQSTTHFKNDLFSIIDGNIVKHNEGNTFNGQQYETLIQSVANDINDPISTKLFRRFYVITNTDDADFEYSKDGDEWTEHFLHEKRILNGSYRIGVKVRNQPHLFWRVRTFEKGFQLRSVGFDFRPRRRIR